MRDEHIGSTDLVTRNGEAGDRFSWDTGRGRSSALRGETPFQKQQRPRTSVPRPVPCTLVHLLLLATPSGAPAPPSAAGTGLCLGRCRPRRATSMQTWS